MDRGIRLLGIAPVAGAVGLADVMGAPVRAVALGAVAALVQPADRPPRALLLRRDRAGLLKQLQAVQRRLEIACQAGPFLACDPGAATCPQDELAAMILPHAEDLALLLESLGRRHQWDVVLRWQPEPVLAARRAEVTALAGGAGGKALADAVAQVLAREVTARKAALRAALEPVVLAIAEAPPAAGDAETGATVVVPAGGEAAIIAALERLDPAVTAGAEADLRGPLPVLAFGPMRVARPAAGEAAAAWTLLGLPEQVDAAELSRRWRSLAFDLHPDRSGADGAALARAGDAYRLLRDAAARTQAGVLARATLTAAAPRLDLPIRESVS